MRAEVKYVADVLKRFRNGLEKMHFNRQLRKYL